jgi:hypothetical protein
VSDALKVGNGWSLSFAGDLSYFNTRYELEWSSGRKLGFKLTHSQEAEIAASLLGGLSADPRLAGWSFWSWLPSTATSLGILLVRENLAIGIERILEPRGCAEF